MKTWNCIELSDEVSYSYLRGHPIIEMTIKGWNDTQYLSDIEVLVNLYAIQYNYTNQTCFKVYYHYDFLLSNVTVIKLVEMAKQQLMAYAGNALQLNY